MKQGTIAGKPGAYTVRPPGGRLRVLSALVICLHLLRQMAFVVVARNAHAQMPAQTRIAFTPRRPRPAAVTPCAERGTAGALD